MSELDKGTLILLGMAPEPDSVEEADRGEIPRIEYVELARALGATILDFKDVAQSEHPAVRIARARGERWGLAVLGMTRRRDFDQFYVTGESIPFGIMMRAARDLGRITVVAHTVGTPKRRLMFRLFGHAVYRNVIVRAERQREILVKELGFPAFKVHQVDRWVDTQFFRPVEAPPGDYIFSCGRENRDYGLLQRAAHTLPYDFRVVASGWAPHAGFETADMEASHNVEILRNLTYKELRDAYARARLVVLPLKRVDYAAGVIGLCEAMAMGKAIITTESPGIQDYVVPGVSALVVPIGDARALAAAIDELMRDPDRCAEMGAHNRDWVVRQMSIERYVARVCGLLGLPR